MTQTRNSLENALLVMHRHIREINSPRGGETAREHNQRCQVGTLLLGERVAALLGEHQVPLERGFAMAQELLDLPGSERSQEDREPLQELLARILDTADRIGETEQTQRDGDAQHETLRTMLQAVDAQHETLRTMLQAVDGPKVTSVPEDHRRQQELLDLWERLAHLTGNHAIELRLGREQPALPLGELHDPVTALGVAALHAGQAVQACTFIREFPRDPLREEVRQQAERDARLAHLALHWTTRRMENPDEEQRAGILTAAREINLWLTGERARTARELGITPIPQESDDLDHHEIDPFPPGEEPR